jgi:two-component system, OmpR family, alkaline phosphatase synthesis response regulator PhoP
LAPEKNELLPPSSVLIVDDNVQNRELLVAYVEEIPNVRTIEAANGIEALAKVVEARPDLVLLDVMMPKMSGFEVCRRLKTDPDTRGIPVLMVTALDEMGDHERAVDSGTDEFLTKPVNRVELVERVTSLLRLRHSHVKRREEAGAAESEQ